MKTAYQKLPIDTLALRALQHAAQKTCANRSNGCAKGIEISGTPHISPAKLQSLWRALAKWASKSALHNKPEAADVIKSP